MADSVTLRAFDLTEALNGAALATSTTGDVGGAVKDYALYFRQEGAHEYVANINRKAYMFREDGVGRPSDGSPKLFIVDTSIKETTGTHGTRADGDSVDVNTLQPRELFAMAALRGMLSRVENPLEIDETSMKILVQQSYKAAAGMMNMAAECRKTAGSASALDESALTMNIEKIWNNISKSLAKIDTLNDELSAIASAINGVASALGSISVTVTNYPENSNG